MDDITRKRLEAERAALSPAIDGIRDVYAKAMDAVRGSSFAAHDAAMEAIGFPREAMPRFSTLFMGIVAGAVHRNGGSKDLLLEIFDIVSQIKETEPYDICCDDIVGDRLEDFYDKMLDVAPPSEGEPTLSLADVMEWGRILRVSTAEFVVSLEMHLVTNGKPLDELRTIARGAARFWVDVTWDMALQQFGEPASAS